MYNWVDSYCELAFTGRCRRCGGGANDHHNAAPWSLIYKISYDNLTIILRYCRSYDRHTTNVQFIKHLTKNAMFFLDTIYLRNHKMVGDSVRNSIYDIPRRNLSTL